MEVGKVGKMKNLYLIGCSDYIAADDEKEACETWCHFSGESLMDYPDLEVELVDEEDVVKVWTDEDQLEMIVKTAGEWAAGADQPEIICSLNW